jgi:hypothetical protein
MRWRGRSHLGHDVALHMAAMLSQAREFGFVLFGAAYGAGVIAGYEFNLSDGSTAYPLNGVARALTRKEPKGRQPLEDIWLVDEKTLAGAKASGVKVKTIRVDISPVLNRGVNWCRSRR